MMMILTKFGKPFIKELLTTALHTTAATIAANVSNRLADAFFDRDQALPSYDDQDQLLELPASDVAQPVQNIITINIYKDNIEVGE